MLIIINTNTNNNNVKDKCNEEMQSPAMSYETVMSLLLLFLMSLVIQFISHSSFPGTPVITLHSISWWSSDNMCFTLKNREMLRIKHLFPPLPSPFYFTYGNYLAYSGFFTMSFTSLPLPISSEICKCQTGVICVISKCLPWNEKQ